VLVNTSLHIVLQLIVFKLVCAVAKAKYLPDCTEISNQLTLVGDCGAANLNTEDITKVSVILFT
jgi:hypothetical protein